MGSLYSDSTQLTLYIVLSFFICGHLETQLVDRCWRFGTFKIHVEDGVVLHPLLDPLVQRPLHALTHQPLVFPADCHSRDQLPPGHLLAHARLHGPPQQRTVLAQSERGLAFGVHEVPHGGQSLEGASQRHDGTRSVDSSLLNSTGIYCLSDRPNFHYLPYFSSASTLRGMFPGGATK